LGQCIEHPGEHMHLLLGRQRQRLLACPLEPRVLPRHGQASRLAGREGSCGSPLIGGGACFACSVRDGTYHGSCGRLRRPSRTESAWNLFAAPTITTSRTKYRKKPIARPMPYAPNSAVRAGNSPRTAVPPTTPSSATRSRTVGAPWRWRWIAYTSQPIT